MADVLGASPSSENEPTPGVAGGWLASRLGTSFLAGGLSKSTLVHYFELVLHEIRDEIAKWRVILAVPYQEYLLSK